MSKAHIARQKGSITVEASLVMPVVILSITALIFMGLLLYQRALLQSAADTAAEKGAAVWSRHTSDISTGKINSGGLMEQSLYWRLGDSGRTDALDEVRKFAEALADHRYLLKPQTISTEAELKDYLIYKELEVKVGASYHIPIGSLLRIFGLSDTFTQEVTACSAVDDPEELIRNTDFIIDIEKELEGINPGLKNLGDKTRGVFADIKTQMSDFLN